MSKILFAVVAVCFAQLAVCRVMVREAPPAENAWIEALNLANQTLNQVHDSFLSIAGVSSDAELWSKTKQNFETFESTVRANVAELDEETKPLQGKAQDLFKSFTAKVTEVTDELKAKNPELFSGDAKKLQAVAERSLRTIVDESQKLREKLQQEGQSISPKIEATLKQVYESAVKTAQEFKTQADNAINTIVKKD